MRDDETRLLTSINPAPTDAGGLSSGRLLVLLFPVITVGLVTVAVAVAAAVAGFYPQQMLRTAAGIGAVLAIPALLLLFRQRAEHVQARRALLGAEARVGGILDSAMDAIITVDEEQKVVLFNQAAEEVFGWPRGEAIGVPLDGFIPERFRTGHRELVRRFGESRETSRRMGHARVVTGLRRNGEEFPIEASISQVTEGGRRFYTVILRDVTERVRADAALRASREELREFALAANSVREQEKSRIARELHDELGQALTAMNLDLAWLREHGGGGAGAAGKLAAMQSLLDETVAAARRISSDLRPLMLDDLGLVAAAEWLVQGFTQRTGVACELVVGTGDFDLPDPHATALFRVLQESLTNAAKHSEATQVEATLVQEDHTIVLTVTDNGRGFEAAGPRKPGTHGMLGLRERAYLLGGEVSIHSEAGQGTRVELRLPAPGTESA